MKRLCLGLALFGMLIGCANTEPPAPPDTSKPLALSTSAAPVDHHRVQIKLSEGVLEFVGSTPVTSRMPIWRGSKRGQWRAVALDDKDQPIHTDHLPDPRLLRGEFHGEPHIEGHAAVLGEVEFLVRVPRGARQVVLYDSRGARFGTALIPEGGAP